MSHNHTQPNYTIDICQNINTDMIYTINSPDIDMTHDTTNDTGIYIAKKCIRCHDFYGDPYCSKCDEGTIQTINELLNLPIEECLIRFTLLNDNPNKKNIENRVIIQRMHEFFKYVMSSINIKNLIIIDDNNMADTLFESTYGIDHQKLAAIIEGCYTEWPKIFFSGAITEYLLNKYCEVYKGDIFWKVQHILALHTIDKHKCLYGGGYECCHGLDAREKIGNMGYSDYYHQWVNHNIIFQSEIYGIELEYKCNRCKKINVYSCHDEVIFCNDCNSFYHSACCESSELLHRHEILNNFLITCNNEKHFS